MTFYKKVFLFFKTKFTEFPFRIVFSNQKCVFFHRKKYMNWIFIEQKKYLIDFSIEKKNIKKNLIENICGKPVSIQKDCTIDFL